MVRAASKEKVSAKSPAKKTTRKRAPKVIDLRPKVAKSAPYRKSMDRTAQVLAELGATDAEIADGLGIVLRTFQRYKLKHQSFSEAIKLGKQAPDERVERSLFQRALGYNYQREKVFIHDGDVIKTSYEEHVAADVTAALAWMNNRQPHKWRRGGGSAGGSDGEAPTTVINARTIIVGRIEAMSKVITGENGPLINLSAEATEILAQQFTALLPKSVDMESIQNGK